MKFKDLGLFAMLPVKAAFCQKKVLSSKKAAVVKQKAFCKVHKRCTLQRVLVNWGTSLHSVIRQPPSECALESVQVWNWVLVWTTTGFYLCSSTLFYMSPQSALIKLFVMCPLSNILVRLRYLTASFFFLLFQLNLTFLGVCFCDL